MARFVRFIIERRRLVGAAILLSLLAASYSARTIEVRFQFRDYFDYPGNSGAELFRRDVDQFGDPAGFIVAMVDADDLFRRDVLAYLQQLTVALEPDPLFSRVVSLTNARVVKGQEDEVSTGLVVHALPESEREQADLRDYVVNHPLLTRRVISTDGTTTAVLAEMRVPAAIASIDQQEEAHNAVASVVERIPVPEGVRVRVTGAPSVEVGTTRALIADQLLLMPAVTGLLLLALYLMFRSLHGIILCMSAVSVATIWTAGLFALTGRPVDIVGSVIPTTILVYGVVDPIFVLSRFLNKLDEGLTKQDAISAALTELALPSFVTSITTALGFAAFVTAQIPSLRTYGLTVAVGVLLSWVTTVTVLPLLLSIVPVPKRRFSTLGTTRRVDLWLQGLWSVIKRRPGITVVAAVALLVSGTAYAREQHINNQYVGGLPRGTTQDSVRLLEDKLSGVVRVLVHLSGPEGVMKRPDVLRAVASVEDSLELHPLVTSATAITDLIAEANQAFSGGDPSARKLPSSQALVAQFLAMLDPSDRADFVTTDLSAAHIVFLLKDEGSEPTRRFTAELQRAVNEANFDQLGVTAELTGNGVVAYQALDHAVLELIYGFVLAFVLIVITQLVVFRSLRIALLGVLPNALPVMGCFVALRWFGIDLKGDNALILCISIGGLFNTTIQFAARLRQLSRETDDAPDELVMHALRAVGPPSVFTVCTLSAGFSILLLSDFSGLRALGALSMLTITLGLIADLVVTPALFRLGFRWKGAALPTATRAPVPGPAE